MQIVGGDKAKAPHRTESGRIAGAACGPIKTEEGHDGSSWGLPSGEWLKIGGKAIGRPPAPGEKRETQVLKLACADILNGSGLANLHYALDPVDIDPLDVAVAINSCGRAPRCLGTVNTETPALSEKYVAGLLAWYAAKVSPDDVKAAMESVEVAPAVANGFIEDYTATHSKVMAVAGALTGAEKAVLVDVPFDVRDEFVKSKTEVAEQLREVAALADKASSERGTGVADDTVAALEELRQTYVKSCGAIDCMKDFVGAAIAKELFFAHISRADPLGARAELPMLPTGNSADAIAAQQKDLMRRHANAADAVERSVRNGVDRQTAIGAAGGVEPHAFKDVLALDYRKTRPNYEAMAPYPPGRARLSEKSYRLKSKKVNGDRTTLVFFDDVRTWDDEICHDTNRVDRVEGGRVYYKQRCRKTGKKASSRREYAPVEVPSHEAKALHKKDHVSLLVMSGEPRTGRVRWAKTDRKKPAVQVRGIRLK